MKLNKQNKEGSVSVVIPQDIIKLNGWNIGDDVMFIPTDDPDVIKVKRVKRNEKF